MEGPLVSETSVPNKDRLDSAVIVEYMYKKLIGLYCENMSTTNILFGRKVLIVMQ